MPTKTKTASKPAASKTEKKVDPALVLARTATDIGTQNGKRAFGAPCSRPQVDAVRKAYGKRDPLKVLGGVSLADLRKYAQGESSNRELPAETRAALTELVSTLPSMKFWARKVAAITVALKTAKR